MAWLTEAEYEDIERNRPHIDDHSFSEARMEIGSQVDCDCSESSIVIATAIHEFSKMINEHLAEWYRLKMEDKREEN